LLYDFFEQTYAQYLHSKYLQHTATYSKIYFTAMGIYGFKNYIFHSVGFYFLG